MALSVLQALPGLMFVVVSGAPEPSSSGCAAIGAALWVGSGRAGGAARPRGAP